MYDSFLEMAGEFGDRIALTNEVEKVSFAELKMQVESVRPLLRCDGDPVLVLLALPSGPLFTAVQIAGLAERAIVAPISHQSTAHEVRNCLHLVRPDVVVVDSVADGRAVLEALEEPTTVLVATGRPEGDGIHRYLGWQDLSPGSGEGLKVNVAGLQEDTRLIQFTSGSTGRPKGILLGERNIRSYLENNRGFLDRFRGRHVFCPMPQFHAFCGTIVLEHLLSGASVHLANTFMPGEDVKRMVEFDCCSILAAPTYLRLLQQMRVLTREYLPRLESVSLGTAIVDQPLVRSLHAAFPDLLVHLRYGLTETMGPITRLSLGRGEDLESAGLVGAPVPGVQLAPGLTIPDVGEPTEVRVKSDVVAQGQLRARGDWTSLVDADGYFHTGDLGYLDAQGRLHLRGRTSSFIKRNGFRINPFEIEALFRDIPGIREVAVLGTPDPQAGQRIVVCVETDAGSKGLDKGTLMKECREHLSVHKLPQAIHFIDDLPRTPSGKPDRPRLLQLLSEA